MLNAIKNAGKFISKALDQKDGYISQVGNLTFPENCRPVFSGNFTSGPTILLNDTEESTIQILSDFTVNRTTGAWSGTIYYDIIDHFGLDKADISGIDNTWRQFIRGFSSWYRLQHIKDYAPFRSRVKVMAKIYGNYKTP